MQAAAMLHSVMNSLRVAPVLFNLPKQQPRDGTLLYRRQQSASIPTKGMAHGHGSHYYRASPGTLESSTIP
jgi:hypothetical protein